MNKEERAKIERIYRDCVNLERRNGLTEYGEGQRDLYIDLLERKGKDVFSSVF